MPSATRVYEIWDALRRARACLVACVDAIANALRWWRARRRRRRRATARDDDATTTATRGRRARVVCLGGALGRELSAMVAEAWTRGREGRRAEVEASASEATRRAIDETMDDDDDATLVFVVETAEGDEPAEEAREAVKMILKEAKRRDGETAGDARRRRYATAMVGDCDIIGDRSAYRSNQSVVDDCNAVGLAVDAALRRFRWTRAAESLRLDKSKEDDDAWRRGRSAAVDAWVAKL